VEATYGVAFNSTTASQKAASLRLVAVLNASRVHIADSGI
jgi:hypothetical protein